MFEQLRDAERRYEETEQLLQSAETVSDPVRYRTLMREYKTQTPVIECYRRYRKATEDAAEAEELLHDPEMKDLAQEELLRAREDVRLLTEELQTLLVQSDPNDQKNVIVEIRAGAGGEEAALFSGVLYRMYSMYADRMGFRIEIMSENETELGGYKEISFLVSGEGAYSKLKYESGVHRVQRVPQTESQGRIQTSTATVAVLPEAEDVEIEINPADLKIESCKSSGAGGQHINKTESAVRITHLPSGMVVECQEERSQFKNKDKALKLLRTRLFDQKQREQTDRIASERRSQVGTGDRSERIRTYNYPQGRVSDHRISLTLYKLEAFLNGDLDEMILALTNADTAEKLKNSTI